MRCRHDACGFRRAPLLLTLVAICWIAPGRNHDAGAMATQVALFRGFGSGPGAGMDFLDTALGLSSIPNYEGMVFGWNEKQAAYDWIQQQSDQATLVLIGHSFGGNSALQLANNFLLPAGVDVDLTIQVDSIENFDGGWNDLLPTNVDAGINYYQSLGFDLHGEDNVVGATNIDAEVFFNDTSITHTSLDNDPRLHAQIILDILGNLNVTGPVDWTNTSNTNSQYETGGNWSPTGPPASLDTGRFNQAATYEVWWNSATVAATPDVGFLEVTAGDVTLLNQETTAQWELAVNGSGGSGSLTDLSIAGAATSLTNSGIHLRSLGGARIVGGASLTIDGSPASGSALSVDGSVGLQVDGNLNVIAGGVVSSTAAVIGKDVGSTGVVTVTGALSQWNNSGDLTVGNGGSGTLRMIGSGASVTVGGDLTFGAGGTLAAEISGLTHSTVVVTGDVVHNSGTLDVTFSGAPVSGAHLYTLVSSGNYTGTFAAHNVPFPVGGAGDAIGRVNPVIYTPTDLQVGLVKPGDADFSSDVTAGGDGSILLGSLGGGGGQQWTDADFSGDGSVTAGDDGSILLGALGSGVYDTATGGTAQVTWNPATGYVSIDADGVALIQMVSAGGNLVTDAGDLVDGFLVGLIDNPDSSDLTFISLSNNLGLIAGFTNEAGYLLEPGTSVDDLSVYYQLVGGSKLEGAIVVVPEPASCVLGGMALAGLFVAVWRRRSA